MAKSIPKVVILLCGIALSLAQGSDPSVQPTKAVEVGVQSLPPVTELLLTGIAAIGETKFIYLTHTSGVPSVELVTGAGAQPGGLEVLQVQDEGPTASWKVLVRSQGQEHWLRFAPASQMPSGTAVAVASAAAAGTLTRDDSAATTAAPTPPAVKAPAQNAGTFANDPALDTPQQAQRRRNNFPLPPGL